MKNDKIMESTYGKNGEKSWTCVKRNKTSCKILQIEEEKG